MDHRIYDKYYCFSKSKNQIIGNINLRILGKGKTALSIKEVYKDAILYDDGDLEKFDKESEELTVVSPGIPPHNHLVKSTKNLVSEYDLFRDNMPFSIWISGTNGKTTTTQMLQHLLKDKESQCGGNIGFPIATLDVKKKIWILETSSFTLHYTNVAKPNIYVLLPVSDDHLSWHGTFEEYEKAKLKPLSLMTKHDIAIIPLKFKSYQTDAKVIYYHSTDDLAQYFKIDVNKIKFKEPFLMDAVIALGVATVSTNEEIDYNKLNTFIQDPHKLEEFLDSKQRIWVDDSKATNVDATIQAIKTYKDKKIYLILGGDDKGANLNPLFEELQKYEIELFFIGKNRELLLELSSKYNVNGKICIYLDEAVEEINLRFKSQEDAVSILSPAAASLDQFSSYKERGEKFKEFVNFLKN